MVCKGGVPLSVKLQKSAHSLHSFGRNRCIRFLTTWFLTYPAQARLLCCVHPWEDVMHRLLIFSLLVLLPSLLIGQAPQTPQSARQALLEMFFGSASDHLEKHLPDTTRKTLKRLDSGDGQNMLAQISMFSA